MRFLLITLLLPSATSLAAEQFTTDAAKAAKAAYEADLKAAREKYSMALDEAAKKAVEGGELDEVVRIKNVKEALAGGGQTPKVRKPEKKQRVLWKHKNGYFERLNDGHWIERVGNGNANLFAQSTNSDEYIEITNVGAIVRIYDQRVEVLLKGKQKFSTFYRGSWVKRD